MLLEQAAWAVWDAAPSPGQAERTPCVRAALEHLRALGYSQVHDMFSQPWLGPVLAALHDGGESVMPVWLYAPVEEAAAFAERPWERPGVRFAGLKAFADGTLNSRTALMTVAYREPESGAHAAPGAWFGKAMMTRAELESAMSRAGAMGVGLAVHAIGDGAVRMVLDAWEAGGGRPRATAANGTPALRIEHAELIDAADVPRFARLGVTCSVQPCHLLSDVEALTRYLPHRLERVLPLRELIDAGCRPGELLWFGSDAPIVPADPMDSITAATKRRRPGMGEHEAIAWGQRIEADEAWSAFCARTDGG
jgi:predicted amidohydrolase YtcJ